ncbi:MAG: hypothetical protein AXW14_07020 [Alteromonas sp. Nap_26]|nr:MAG: hypothetical protein AXW14_07020 [Alteromonas sp. Nap_26]
MRLKTTIRKCPLSFICLCSWLSTIPFEEVKADEIERYTVTVPKPLYDKTLQQIFPQYHYSSTTSLASTHANEIVLQSPSVNLNGQGGQIQNINIRGFSRWRIQSLVDGVPIVSDRRAGSSVGFLPPQFIAQADVVPGATSTYLGSGAIGGAINLQFFDVIVPHVRLSWGHNQNLQQYSYADVSGNTDWQGAFTNAGKGIDAQNRELMDAYTQSAFFLRHRPESSTVKEVWTLYSHNSDIGKSSSDYPNDRITIYPQNTHWLGKMRIGLDTLAEGTTANIWWHQSNLETSTTRIEKRRNDSDNKAFDFGSDISGSAEFSDWFFNWQWQVSAREGVSIDESEYALTSSVPIYKLRTLDASEYNTAVITDVSSVFGNFAIASGGRLDWQRQSNNSVDVTSLNVSGFTGANYTLSAHWNASLYVSSAFRNPSLTERFFFGETPRGTVRGDENLLTEEAINTQGTLFYNNANTKASVEVFHQKINNYIERIDVSDDSEPGVRTLQYANIQNATIRGVTYQIQWHPSHSAWQFRVSGAWIKGQNDQGGAIADIPPHNQRLDVNYEFSDFRVFTTLSYRSSKRDIGSGEREVENIVTADIGGEWQISQRLRLHAKWKNITNQLFYSSTDEQAAFAQGSNVNIGATVLL